MWDSVVYNPSSGIALRYERTPSYILIHEYIEDKRYTVKTEIKDSYFDDYIINNTESFTMSHFEFVDAFGEVPDYSKKYYKDGKEWFVENIIDVTVKMSKLNERPEMNTSYE